jgi:anti-anti-sigma factor
MDTTKILRRNRITMTSECFENAHVFRVRCDIATRATMAELHKAVEKALDEGLRTIAISFTADSYLFSEMLPHLLRLQRLVDSRGAQLRLVESDPELRAILDRIGITQIIQVAASVSELPFGIRKN